MSWARYWTRLDWAARLARPGSLDRQRHLDYFENLHLHHQQKFLLHFQVLLELEN